MISRKDFIRKSALTAAAISIPASGLLSEVKKYPAMKSNNPKKALVIWYSQTGHTRRIGRIISKAWEKKGIKTDSADYRYVDPASLSGYDIIAVGSPVYYLDVPWNLMDWLVSMPSITGAAVASFVTFGGKGDNQHNTACAILERLIEKGGVPAGLELFGNMSTYAPTWSLGNEGRILKFRNTPNRETYARARSFADEIISRVKQNAAITVKSRFESGVIFKHMPQISGTRFFMKNHYVDKKKCILCRTCEKGCPVNAIHPETGNVEREKCILCMGCVNNCPADAVFMTLLGKKIYGFQEFKKRNGIVIEEPDELKG